MKENKDKPDVGEAILTIKKMVHEDPDYAWGWQCNIAMCSYDEGLDLSAANRAAARFMRSLFGIDMTKHEHYPDTQKEYTNDDD